MQPVRQILRRSAIVTWRSKPLWVAGILVTILGVSSEFDLLGRLVDLDASTFLGELWQTFDQAALLTPSGARNALALLRQDPASFGISAGLLLGLVAVVVVMFVAALLAVGMLVANAAAVDAGRPLPLAKRWRASRRTLGRTAAVTVGFTLAFVAAVLLLRALLAAPAWAFAAVFTAASLAALAGALLLKLAVAFAVLQGASLTECLRRAVALLVRRLPSLLVLAVTVEGVRLLSLVAYRSALQILDPPATALIAAAANAGGADLGLLAYRAILLLGMLASVLLAGALLTFQWSAWTLILVDDLQQE